MYMYIYMASILFLLQALYIFLIFKNKESWNKKIYFSCLTKSYLNLSVLKPLFAKLDDGWINYRPIFIGICEIVFETEELYQLNAVNSCWKNEIIIIIAFLSNSKFIKQVTR